MRNISKSVDHLCLKLFYSNMNMPSGINMTHFLFKATDIRILTI